MRHALSFVLLLVGWLCTSPCLADVALYAEAPSTSAPIGGDSRYTLVLGTPLGPSWSHSDEAWYRRNRAFATAGKVLTVVGLALIFASTQTPQQAPLLVSGAVVQSLGQLVWSGAEVRGANELQRRGFRVGNTAGIVALCGALLLAPLTWIAGPIQSAQIRRAHAELTLSRGSKGPTFASYGLGFRGRF